MFSTQTMLTTHIATLRSDLKRPFRLLLCGDPALIVEMRALLLRAEQGHEPSDDAAALLETIAPHRRETWAGDDIKLIVFLGRRGDEQLPLTELTHFRVPILALVVDPENQAAPAPLATPAAGRVERLIVPNLELDALKVRAFPYVAEAVKAVAVPVAQRYPVLREAICALLTRDAARSAMKVSAASALVDQVPILGFLVSSASDLVAISAIQMNLALKIGGAYRRDPELATVWELLPIVGGGFGWRALSRELSGFVPMAGLAIKAAIAYAGTVVVGEGVAFYYRTGRHMSSGQVAEIYADTKRAAVEIAREFFVRLRRR